MPFKSCTYIDVNFYRIWNLCYWLCKNVLTHVCFVSSLRSSRLIKKFINDELLSSFHLINNIQTNQLWIYFQIDILIWINIWMLIFDKLHEWCNIDKVEIIKQLKRKVSNLYENNLSKLFNIEQMFKPVVC